MKTGMNGCSQTEQRGMRRAVHAWLAVIALCVFLAPTSHAANRGPMNIFQPVVAGGQSLAPGTYSVKWTGTGPDVRLSIARDGNVVATVPARIEELAKPEPWDSVILTAPDGGKQSLLEIHFSGRRYVISLATGASSTAENDKGN